MAVPKKKKIIKKPARRSFGGKSSTTIKRKVVVKSRRLNGSGSRLKATARKIKVVKKVARRVTVLDLQRSKRKQDLLFADF